jgi:hypothetical protein
LLITDDGVSSCGGFDHGVLPGESTEALRNLEGAASSGYDGHGDVFTSQLYGADEGASMCADHEEAHGDEAKWGS